MVVVNALPVGGVEGVRTVCLLLRGASGQYLAAIGHLKENGPVFEGADLLKELAADSKLKTEIPKEFSNSEIESIKFSGVEEGMSMTAVLCSKGFPDHENDYGHGEEQWVYDDGQLIVYFDETDKVTTIQHFSE